MLLVRLVLSDEILVHERILVASVIERSKCPSAHGHMPGLHTCEHIRPLTVQVRILRLAKDGRLWQSCMGLDRGQYVVLLLLIRLLIKLLSCKLLGDVQLVLILGWIRRLYFIFLRAIDL